MFKLKFLVECLTSLFILFFLHIFNVSLRFPHSLSELNGQLSSPDSLADLSLLESEDDDAIRSTVLVSFLFIGMELLIEAVSALRSFFSNPPVASVT